MKVLMLLLALCVICAKEYKFGLFYKNTATDALFKIDNTALLIRDAFTEEVWVKSAESTLPALIKLFFSSQAALQITPSTNMLQLTMTDDSTAASLSGQTTHYVGLDSRWNYVMMQYNGRTNSTPTLRAQYNEKEVASLLGQLRIASSEHIAWTAQGDSGLLLRGYRLYNKWIPQTQILNLQEPTVSDKMNGVLMAYYPLDEPQLTHFDYSKFARHFSYPSQTPKNDVTPDFVEPGKFHSFHHVIQFSKTALGPEVPLPPAAFENKVVTVDMWLAFTRSSTYFIPIVGLRNRVLHYGFEIVMDSLNSRLLCHFLSTVDYNPPLTISFSPTYYKWYHYACVNTLTYSQVLLNGQPMVNSTFQNFDPSEAFKSSLNLVFGKRESTMQETMCGFIREFRMWNEGLDGWHLKRLMHQRISGRQKASLVLYYTLGDNTGRMLFDQASYIRGEVSPRSAYSSLYSSTATDFSYILLPGNMTRDFVCDIGSFYDYSKDLCFSNIQNSRFAYLGNSRSTMAITYPIGLTNTFTVELWVYPTEITGTHVLYKLPSFVELGFTASQIYATFVTNRQCKYTQTLPTSTWTHLGFSYTHSSYSMSMFYNGVSKAECTTTDIGAPSYPLSISQLNFCGESSTLFVGYMTNFRVWKKAISKMKYYYKRSFNMHSDLHYNFAFDEGFGNSVRDSNNPSANALFLSDPHWNLVYSLPEVCPHDSYFNGSSCANDFRVPVIVASSSSLLVINGINFGNEGNLMFWFYPLGTNLETKFESGATTCIKLVATASQFETLIEGTSFTEASFTFPTLKQWHHLALRFKAVAGSGASRAILDGVSFVSHALASSTCTAITSGKWTCDTSQAYFRHMIVTAALVDTDVVDAKNRYNPCEVLRDKFCTSSVYALYLPLDDGMGVPYFRNLVMGSSGYSFYLTSPHNSGIVWKTVEPLIICGYRWIYDPATGICKKQNPIPMEYQVVTTTINSGSTLANTYIFWIYVPNDSVAELKLISFSHRADTCLQSIFYIDTSNSKILYEFVYQKPDNSGTTSTKINTAISSKGKWYHIQGMVREIATATPSLVTYELNLITGIRQHPSISSVTSNNIITGNAFDVISNANPITITVHACPTGSSSCNYHIHDQRIFSISGAANDPYYPNVILNLKVIWEFMTVGGKISKYDPTSGILSITSSLIDTSLNVPSENLEYYDTYTEAGTGRTGIIQNSIKSLKITKDRYQPLYIPIEGRLTDNSCWTIETWVFANPAVYDDDTISTLFGIGNTVNCFHELRIDKSATTAILAYTSFGATPTITPYTSVSLTASGSTWNYLYLRVRNHTGNLDISYGGYYNDLQGAASSTNQAISDLGVTGKYKYLVLGENPLAPSSRTKGVYFKSVKLWDVYLTTNQLKMQAYQPISRNTQSSRLISAFDFSTVDNGEVWDMGYHSCSVVRLKSYVQQEDAEIVSFSEFCTTSPQDEIDNAPLNFMGKGGQYLYRNVLQSANVSRSLHITSSLHLALEPYKIDNSIDWSVEFWIKVIRLSSSSRLIFQDLGDSSLSVVADTTSWYLKFLPMRITNTLSMAVSTTWHHFSLVNSFSSGYCKLCKFTEDVRSTASSVMASALNLSSPIKFGTDNSDTHYYIKEFRVFRYTLTDDQVDHFRYVQIDTELQKQLALYYRFDEGDGTLVFDCSRPGVNSTIVLDANTQPYFWEYESDLSVCAPGLSYNSEYMVCSDGYSKYYISRSIDFPITYVDSQTVQGWVYYGVTISQYYVYYFRSTALSLLVWGGSHIFSCYTPSITIPSTFGSPIKKWTYIACTSSPLYTAFLHDDEYREYTSHYGYTNGYYGNFNFPTTPIYLKHFQIWYGVRNLQQILASKNRYYYSHPQLLMYTPMDEQENSMNYAIFEEQTTSVPAATFDLHEHSIFPIINDKYDCDHTTLRINQSNVTLQLPTKIWYLIHKAFIFRLWVKLVGSSVSSPVILFGQDEVMNIKILPNLSVSLDLVNPEEENVMSLSSPYTLNLNSWNLITVSKNKTDNFMFAVNSTMYFQYYPFEVSLNQSYNYTSYMQNPNANLEVYLKELYLVDDYLTPLQHKLLFRNKLDVRFYPKSSYVYYSMDAALKENYLYNEATHYNEAHIFMQSISYSTTLPSDATWAFDSTFPKLCFMDEQYVDGYCIKQDKTLWFDGSNTYKVQFPISPITVEYSWEMWLYLPGYTTTKSQFILGIENSKELYVNIISSATTRFRFYGSAPSGTNQNGNTYYEASTSVSTALHNWIYLIVANSQQSNKCFIYGSWMHNAPSSVSQPYFPHVTPSSYMMTLGSEKSSYEFEGSIRELRIYNVYRGVGIGSKFMYNVLDPRYQEGLLHYFRLHEGHGLLLSDYSYNQASYNVTREVTGKSAPRWVYVPKLDMLSPEISSDSFSVEPEFTFSSLIYTESYNRISYTLQLWVSLTPSATMRINNGEFDIQKYSDGRISVLFCSSDYALHYFPTTTNTYTFLHIALNSANQTAYGYATNFLGQELWNFFEQNAVFSIGSIFTTSINIQNGGERIKSVVLKQDFSMIDPTNLTSILFPFDQYSTVYQDSRILSYYNPTWILNSKYSIDQSLVGYSTSFATYTKKPHFISTSHCYPKVTGITCKDNCTCIVFNFGKDISFGIAEESKNATEALCENVFTKKTMDRYFGVGYSCNISGSYFNVFVGENWNLEIGHKLRYRENRVVVKHCPFSNFDFSGITHYSYSPDVMWLIADATMSFSTQLDFYFVLPQKYYQCSDLILNISRIGGLARRPHKSIEYRVINIQPPAGFTNISAYAISAAAINSYLALQVSAAGSTLLTQIAVPRSYLYLGTTYTFQVMLINFLNEIAVHTQTTQLNTSWPPNILIKAQSSFANYTLLSYHNSTEDLNCSSHRGDKVIITTSAWSDNFCNVAIENYESDYVYVVTLESPSSQAATVLGTSEGKVVILNPYTLDAEQEYRFSFNATLKGNKEVYIKRYVNLYVKNDVLKPVILVQKAVIWTSEQIKLNASAYSRDYNYAEAGTPNLNYYWNCINMSTLFGCCDKNGNYLSFGTNSPSLTYDASILNPGILNFSLYIMADTRVSATTYQAVEVRYNSSEILWIRASTNNYTRTNIQDALILYMEVETIYPLDSYSYYWDLPALLDNYQYYQEVNEYSEVRSNKYLYIYPYTLKENVQYKIVCSVFHQLSFLKNQTFVISANSPPSGGTFSISPTSGNEYSTNFTLSLSNWVDSDLPLNFSFFYRLAGESMWLSFEPTNYVATFPSGNPNLNYKIEVRAQIQDSYGGITNSAVTIHVYSQLERYQLYSSLKEKLLSHTSSERCKVFNQLAAYLVSSRAENYAKMLANLTVFQMETEIGSMYDSNSQEVAINLLYVISKTYSEVVQNHGNKIVALISNILQTDIYNMDIPQENPLKNFNSSIGLSESALNLSSLTLSTIIQTKSTLNAKEVGRCLDLLGIQTVKSYYTLTNSAVTLKTSNFEIVSSKVRNTTAPSYLNKYSSMCSITLPMQLLMENEEFLYVIVTQINRDIHYGNSSLSSLYLNNTNQIVRISLLNQGGSEKNYEGLSTPISVNFYGYKASYPLCMFYNESSMLYSTNGVSLIAKTGYSVLCNSTHLTEFTVFESVFHEPEDFGARISFIVVCITTALVGTALIFGFVKDHLEKDLQGSEKTEDSNTLAHIGRQSEDSCQMKPTRQKEPLALCEIGLLLYIRTHCYFRVFSHYNKDFSRFRRAVLYSTRLLAMCSLIVMFLYCNIGREYPILISLALPYIVLPLGYILEFLLGLQQIPFLRCEKFQTWMMKYMGVVLCAIFIIAGIVTFIIWDCLNDPSLRRLQSQCLIYLLIYDLVFHQLFYALILTMLYSGLFGNPGSCYQDIARMLIPQDAIQGIQDFYDEFAQ